MGFVPLIFWIICERFESYEIMLEREFIESINLRMAEWVGLEEGRSSIIGEEWWPVK